MNKKWAATPLVYVLIVAAFVAGTVGAAGAITLMTIQGTVRDPAGTPLQNVAVSDGSQVTYTDAAGHYSLNESSVNSYRITASRLGLDPASKTVGPVEALSSVDFELTYWIGLAFDRQALNNSEHPSIQIVLTSYAPTTGCARWTDVSSNDSQDLLLTNAVVGGMSTWAGSYTVSSLSEGSYPSAGLVTVCSSGTPLTKPAANTYLIDNTAPLFQRLAPLEGGNTIFSDQPVTAQVSDAAVPGMSGVDSSSGSITLTDSTTGISSTVAAPYGLSGWMKSPNFTLVEGHVYRASASITDLAGNEATIAHTEDPTGGFMKVSIDTDPVPGLGRATIPVTQCSVSNQLDGSGMKTATCPNVPLHYDTSQIALTDSHHSYDSGFVVRTASLRTAKITTTIAGLPGPPLDAYQASDAAWADKAKSLRFALPDEATLPATTVVETRDFNLGTLTTKVPPTAGSTATLSMDSVLTTASTDACADPSSAPGPLPCTPDPTLVRFVVELAPGNDVGATAAQHAQTYGVAVRVLFDTTVNQAYEAAIPFSSLSLMTSSPTVLAIHPMPSIQHDISDDIRRRAELHFIDDPASIVAMYQSFGPGPYIQRDLLLTAEEAVEYRLRMDLADDVGIIHQYLEEVDAATFGGIYLDNEDGKLHVQLTGEEAAHRAAILSRVTHPDRIEFEVVDFTDEYLNSIKDQLTNDNALLDAEGIRIASVGLRTRANRVGVVVYPLTPTVESRLRADYGGPALVFAEGPASGSGAVPADRTTDASPPMFGGYRISNINTLRDCTTNFSYRSGSTYYVGTGGHCAAVGQTMSHLGWLAATAKSVYQGGVDYEAALVSASVTTKTPKIIRQYPFKVLVKRAEYPYENYPGMARCKSGITTNETCGLILDGNEDVRVDGANFIIKKTVVNSATVKAGDSGGPVYCAVGGHPDDNVHGSGITFGYLSSHTDIDGNGTDDYGSLIYTRLVYALPGLGVSLVTG